MKRVGWLGALAFAACGGDERDRFAPDHVVEVAWRSFDRTDPAFPVAWVRNLNCDEGRGFLVDGRCLGSEWVHRRGYVRVALPGLAPRWSDLCHALGHAVHEVEGQPDSGENDAAHQHPDFQPGGRVPACTDLLDDLSGGAGRPL